MAVRASTAMPLEHTDGKEREVIKLEKRDGVSEFIVGGTVGYKRNGYSALLTIG